MWIFADLRFTDPLNHSELWPRYFASGHTWPSAFGWASLFPSFWNLCGLEELKVLAVLGNVRGKKLEFKQRGNFEFMICLSTHYIIKTQEIQEIWNLRGWATQIIMQCDLICSRVVSEILVTQITWNDCQFLRRGECYAMMFQGSRNLDLQPIAHLAHWVVAMLCNVWIHFGTSHFRSTPWVSPLTHIPWQQGVGKKQEDEACKVAEGDGETSDHHHTRWGLYRQAGWDEFPICYLHLFAINFITVVGMIRYYVFSLYSQYSLFNLISCLLFRAVFFGGYVSVKAKRQVWRQVKPCSSGSPPSKHAMKKRQCGRPLC